MVLMSAKHIFLLLCATAHAKEVVELSAVVRSASAVPSSSGDGAVSIVIAGVVSAAVVALLTLTAIGTVVMLRKSNVSESEEERAVGAGTFASIDGTLACPPPSLLSPPLISAARIGVVTGSAAVGTTTPKPSAKAVDEWDAYLRSPAGTSPAHTASARAPGIAAAASAVIDNGATSPPSAMSAEAAPPARAAAPSPMVAAETSARGGSAVRSVANVAVAAMKFGQSAAKKKKKKKKKKKVEGGN